MTTIHTTMYKKAIAEKLRTLAMKIHTILSQQVLAAVKNRWLLFCVKIVYWHANVA